MFFNSVSKILVLRLNKPFFSVLTPKFDKYIPLAPNPDNCVDVSEFNCEFILFITGSSDKSPAFWVDEPRKVLSFNNVLASFTALTKDCKFVLAAVVSTEPVNIAGVSVPFIVVDESKFTL